MHDSQNALMLLCLIVSWGPQMALSDRFAQRDVISPPWRSRKRNWIFDISFSSTCQGPSFT